MVSYIFGAVYFLALAELFYHSAYDMAYLLIGIGSLFLVSTHLSEKFYLSVLHEINNTLKGIHQNTEKK